MEPINLRVKEMLKMGIFNRKKAYTLIGDDQNVTDLVIKDKKEIEEILENNSENILSFPIKILDNFEEIGVLFKKNLNRDQSIQIKDKQQEATKRAKVNPLNMITMSANPLTAPLLVFKMFNAIAGVSHLDKINHRLDDITKKLDRLTLRHQASSYGEVIGIINTFKEIEHQYKITNNFTSDMVIRMSLATSNIQKIIFEYNLLLDQFISRSNLILNEKKTGRNASMINKMIKDEESEINFDYNLYLTALRAKVSSTKTWLIYDLLMNPEFVGERLKMVEQDLQLLENNYNKLDRIKDLNEFVRQTFEEMNWFQKKINKKLKSDVIKRDLDNEDDNGIQNKEVKSNLIIFKDKNKINFLQLEEEEEED